MQEHHKAFMEKSLDLARYSYSINEVPVGAIVTLDNKIIGEGFNSGITKNSPIYHAEINAINMACSTIRNFRLVNCVMYVTLEPCHMCAKAIIDARIDKVYFAAREPKTGSIVSIDNFFEKEYLNHHVAYEEGMMMKESSKLLKNFFSKLRNKD